MVDKNRWKKKERKMLEYDILYAEKKGIKGKKAKIKAKKKMYKTQKKHKNIFVYTLVGADIEVDADLTAVETHKLQNCSGCIVVIITFFVVVV